MPASRVTNSDTFKATTPSDREVVLTRLFDAPPRLVFEAMTTRFTATCLYRSLEVRDMVLKTGMTTGAGISYDRLEDLVKELQRS